MAKVSLLTKIDFQSFVLAIRHWGIKKQALQYVSERDMTLKQTLQYVIERYNIKTNITSLRDI